MTVFITSSSDTLLDKSSVLLAILYTDSSGFIRSRILNPPVCIFVDNWVYKNFILADKPFAKALRTFKTCVLVNDNLCEILGSSLQVPVKFDERFKVTSVSIFSYLNLLNC